ncbi:MAG: glycoside hydrolase family 88 protein [Clostridia bacterium]|nr:glycoside hydrolase family 88 protein [Clostridia bacterium]
MERGNVKINNPERFKGDHSIAPEKLQAAIKKATDKLASKLDIYKDGFPQNMKQDGTSYNFYKIGENNSWQSGMHTGTLILAYQLTGEQKFLDATINHIPTYQHRFDNRAERKYDMNSHDVGFAFSPSMVALYKLTGNEDAKRLALGAALHFYNIAYSERGKFIVRSPMRATEDWACRTMMDTLMNAPLLFWAGEETDNTMFTEAAYNQEKITRDLLIREDGSSYHHYQFDPITHKPVGGVTFQGNRDESTWSRGQAWGVYGFAIGYDYTGDDSLLKVQNDTVAYTLNNLPDDLIPYWDYDFTTGSDEPRDSSAAIISACGMLEAIKYMPENAPEIEIYQNAASMLVEAVIDKYTGDTDNNGLGYDGLYWGCTGARKFDIGIEGCAQYGDYFYLEALLRLSDPDWKRFW